MVEKHGHQGARPVILMLMEPCKGENLQIRLSCEFSPLIQGRFLVLIVKDSYNKDGIVHYIF